MATDRVKITFYADPDIAAAYQELSHMQRSTWLNDMIRKGMTSKDGDEGLRGLHAYLTKYRGDTDLERELEALLAEYLEV